MNWIKDTKELKKVTGKKVTDKQSVRKPFQGVLNILRFNWDFYLGAAIAFVVAIVIAAVINGLAIFPSWVTILIGLGCIGLAYFIIGSLFVSYWVYDASPLYKWIWLESFLDKAPEQALNIHAGFDESSASLKELFPNMDLVIADFYDPEQHTEKSIERARAAYPSPPNVLSVQPTHLPYDDSSMDTIFLLFAAHEIRNPEERQQFFQELKRILKAEGELVLVEHLRDLTNTLAFGPGAWHFYPLTEWQAAARQSGFKIDIQKRSTPFVITMKLVHA